MSKKLFILVGFSWLLAIQPSITHTSYHRLSLPVLTVEVSHQAVTIEPAEKLSVLSRKSHSIKSGDTLHRILGKWGVSGSEIKALTTAAKPLFDLRNIQPSQTLRGVFAPGTQKLLALEYSIDREKLLVVEQSSESFEAHIDTAPLERRLRKFEATVETSLYDAAMAAEMPSSLALQMVEVFSPVVDFRSDLKAGDQIQILAEAFYERGKLLRTGPALAVFLNVGGKSLQAFRFHNDYYDETGQPLRRSLLRAPLASFRRVSSSFRARRVHPITGQRRPHFGVDLSAQSGTAIYAAGDGEVSFSGWKSGYGRTVKIQHDAVYETLYAHMSRFAPGVTQGSRVKQGEIIGYVGQSGLATAPHLHYEIIRHGRSVNPMTVELPSGEPLDAAGLEAFQKFVQDSTRKLEAPRVLIAQPEEERADGEQLLLSNR